MKLKSITAIWLANNQTKPLVQLNHDTDPYTGQKVLTNFLLPQQVGLQLISLQVNQLVINYFVPNPTHNLIKFNSARA